MSNKPNVMKMDYGVSVQLHPDDPRRWLDPDEAKELLSLLLASLYTGSAMRQIFQALSEPKVRETFGE